MKKNLIIAGGALTGSILMLTCVSGLIQQSQIKDLNRKLNNQTAILNRVIGENIPVIVPEAQQKKFDELCSAVDAASKKENEEKLNKAIELYYGFIRTASPWIQESLSNEILNVKYELDFISIKVDYKKDQNTESAFIRTKDFIETSSDWEKLPEATAFYDKLAEQLGKGDPSTLLEERELLNQVSQAAALCRQEIINIKNDITFTPMVTLLASQLASLKHDAQSVSVADNKKQLAAIEDCITLLKSKENDHSKMTGVQENEDLKKYNASALKFISDIKKKAGDISVVSSDKKQKRLALFLELESIQSNYLYQPVASLYQEVYADIWGGLDSDTRFEAASKALTIEKKGLNDNF